MEESQDFGDLRAMCHKCSPDSFMKIRRWLARSEAEQPGVYASQWSDYVSRALESWPTSYKHAKVSHIADREHELANAPWMELVTSVELADLDLSDREVTDWLVSSLREHFPALDTLTISGPYSRTKSLGKLCEQGFFDDLKSLYFRGYSLHPTAIEVIASKILSRADKLTTLGLVACDITDAKLSEFFKSPHLAQLEHLDLSDNVSFEKRLPVYLASHAPQFERLTHITMRDVEPRQKGMRVLLEADWPAGLQKLVLTPHRLTSKHIALLDKMGKLDMIVSDEPGQSMMLSRSIDQKAFDMMCRAKLFSNVIDLDCDRDSITDFSALGDTGITLEALRIARNWGEEEPRWDTLESCTRGPHLERLIFVIKAPGSAWLLDLLEHKGDRLAQIGLPYKADERVPEVLRQHTNHDTISWIYGLK